MATAAAKKATVERRPTTKPAVKTPAKLSTTNVASAPDVVEQTKGDSINLSTEALTGDKVTEMVTVIVPQTFTLTRAHGDEQTFEAGVQEMSVDDAAHWWSRAQGVKVYTPKK